MWNRLLDSSLRSLVATGRLTVVDSEGRRRSYGPGGKPEIDVQFLDPALPRKLVLNPDLALGEAYVDARLKIAGDDLPALLTLLLMGVSSAMASRTP